MSLTASPRMASIMLTGMLVMGLAAWMYAIGAALVRVQSIIVEREAGADWLGGYVRGTKA